MKAPELHAELLAQMQDGVKAVIAGKRDTFKARNVSPQMIDDLMRYLEFQRGDMDSNGWQHDWWLPFTKDGKSFTAFGQCWDGSFEFSKTEE